jgi:saccharopine dehydrogenase-like NADP-dependent oxidoreductase
MKITVIGAGVIGSAVATELLAHDDVTQVQVCDASGRVLQELHNLLRTPRVRSFQVDARDPNTLRSILEGSACTIGCVAPQLNPALAELCLSLGIHFCDLGGNDALVEKELTMADRARDRGIWIVPNCGLAPGLVNVLCLLGVEQFEEVHAAHIRVGDVPLHPEPPFNFRIAWSVEKVIEDYTHPVRVIADGQVSAVAPLSGVEPIFFPGTSAPLEAFCTGGSLSGLIEALVGRVHTLDHKTICYAGHAHQMQFLLGLGFGDRHSIDVRTHLSYRDVLVRRMRQRLGGEHEDRVLLRVLIQGRREGQDASLVFEMVAQYDEPQGLSAMRRCTAIPVATVAMMIARGQVTGAGADLPEQVVSKAAYCGQLTERGLPLQAHWYEGHVSVEDPQGTPVHHHAPLW